MCIFVRKVRNLVSEDYHIGVAKFVFLFSFLKLQNVEVNVPILAVYVVQFLQSKLVFHAYAIIDFGSSAYSFGILWCDSVTKGKKVN